MATIAPAGSPLKPARTRTASGVATGLRARLLRAICERRKPACRSAPAVRSGGGRAAVLLIQPRGFVEHARRAIVALCGVRQSDARVLCLAFRMAAHLGERRILRSRRELGSSRARLRGTLFSLARARVCTLTARTCALAARVCAAGRVVSRGGHAARRRRQSHPAAVRPRAHSSPAESPERCPEPSSPPDMRSITP